MADLGQSETWITVPDEDRCEAVSSRGQRCGLPKDHDGPHYFADAYRPAPKQLGQTQRGCRRTPVPDGLGQSVCPGCRRPLTHGVVLTRNGRREHTDCTGARLLELEDAVERIWLATGSFPPDHVAGEIHAIAEEVRRAR